MVEDCRDRRVQHLRPCLSRPDSARTRMTLETSCGDGPTGGRDHSGRGALHAMVAFARFAPQLRCWTAAGDARPRMFAEAELSNDKLGKILKRSFPRWNSDLKKFFYLNSCDIDGS